MNEKNAESVGEFMIFLKYFDKNWSSNLKTNDLDKSNA